MDNRVCDFVLEAASDRLELGVQVTYALACVSEQRRVQFLDRLVEGLLRTIDAASTDADTHSKCLSRLLTQCAGNLDHTLQQLHAILLEQHEQIDQAKVCFFLLLFVSILYNNSNIVGDRASDGDLTRAS